MNDSNSRSATTPFWAFKTSMNASDTDARLRDVPLQVVGPPLRMAPMLRQFWKRFWMPPRAHGDVRHDRQVSHVELFYDLVFVVVVARAAHVLSRDVTGSGVAVFAVVFGMVWILWLNGTLYYELHGREDGRTRSFVFIEMILSAILAVFTEGANGEYGREFATVYAVLLGVTSLYWWDVQRFDDPKYLAPARRYVGFMLFGLVMGGGSVAAPEAWRLWMWAVANLSVTHVSSASGLAGTCLSRRPSLRPERRL